MDMQTHPTPSTPINFDHIQDTLAQDDAANAKSLIELDLRMAIHDYLLYATTADLFKVIASSI